MSQTLGLLVSINAFFGIVQLGTAIYLIYKIVGLYKKERIALLIGEDKRPAGYVVIDRKKDVFKDKDKNLYNAQKEPQIRFGNKEFLVYRYNKADPIDIFDKEHSRMTGDVYAAIFDNELVKAIARLKSGINFNWKTLLIIGGVVIFVLVLMQGGIGG